MKTKKLIPELRFPEFVDKDEWEEKKLGEVGEPLMCKRIFKEQTTSNPENGIPFYKIGTFGRKADSFIPIDLYEEYKIQYSFPNAGDILISASGTIGRLVVYDGAPAYFQDSNIVWLGNNELLIINSFLFYCYATLKWQTSDGGIISRLYNSDFKNMSIKYPKKKTEQKKIASCLSSLDEVIAAESEKLDVLKEHKKGLMQNLFPQEGEKVPKYRFPDFKNDGEWKYINGDKLFDSISDKNHNSDLQILAITQEYGAIPREIIDYTVIATAKSIESYKVVQKGNFIISLRSFQGGIEYSNYKGICSPAYIILKKKTNLENIFFKYYFKTDLYIRHLNKNLEGIRDGKMVSYKQFSEIPLPLPPIKEQQKIADCLSSLDELIKAQSDRIEQLKLHKKGLMQGLFPKMND